MHRVLIAALRVGIAAALLFGFFAQIVIIPGTAANEVDNFPPYEPYATPYVVLAILGVLCVQVGLVAAWMLLGMVGRGALFSPRAFRWVDLIIGAAGLATVLALGASAHLGLATIPSPDDSMDVVSAMGAATVAAGVGAAFVMLTVILRGLLHKATALETEMAEVV